jgi:hypothetical protein
MKQLTELPTTYRVVESCHCNKCGREMLTPMGNICGVEVYIEGCYESPVLNDCTTYTFDLCEYCLRDLFDSFAHPVSITEHSV